MDRRKLVCADCGYFIGVLDNRRGVDEVTIKHKGLFVYFQGGMLRITCPKCGVQNFVCDDDYRKKYEDSIESMKSYNHIIECEIQKWIPSSEYIKTKPKEKEDA